MAVLEKRLEMTLLHTDRDRTADGSELVTALCRNPKMLPPSFLYDSRGRELYDRLISLPERYTPRIAKTVLKRYAGEVPAFTGGVDLIELGAEDIATTRELLDAFRKPGRRQLYVPVSGNADIIQNHAPSLLRQYPDLTIHGLSGEGGSAVGSLPPREADTRMIVCLENALGQLTEEASRAFLQSVRRSLRTGDWFLAGVDLETEIDVLEAAYNDSEGLTAQLNFNALHHINRHYGGQIDISKFSHRAFFNESEHQMEMRLCSREHQVVDIPGLGFQFEMLEGSCILTEFSRKFTMSRVTGEFGAAGFGFVEAWADAKELYALFLFQAE